MKRYFLRALITTMLALSAGCHTISSGFTGIGGQSDAAITASIKTAIESDIQFSGVPVRIETHKGQVQLGGYVKTIRQSDTAADIAGKTPGVTMVENNLIVRK